MSRRHKLLRAGRIFVLKMAIAAKEAREVEYWLRLTRDGNVVPESGVAPLFHQIDEIKRILTAIVKSSSN